MTRAMHKSLWTFLHKIHVHPLYSSILLGIFFTLPCDTVILAKLEKLLIYKPTPIVTLQVFNFSTYLIFFTPSTLLEFGEDLEFLFHEVDPNLAKKKLPKQLTKRWPHLIRMNILILLVLLFSLFANLHTTLVCFLVVKCLQNLISLQ